MSERAQNTGTLPVSETSEHAKSDTIADGNGRSVAVWSRAALLFGALCLIKMVLLFSLRKHLFETHWRTSLDPVTWECYLAFYVFAALVGLNFWVFAIRCERSGVRVVRGANACLLALCSLFILLTFSESGQNYISAVMNAYLDLKDLRWFLIMNFCFRWPYLTLWVVGYALIYYGLYRKKKEYLVLRVTAVLALLYVLLFLRDFVAYRKTLIVVDCIGLATLLGGWKAKNRLNPLIVACLAAFMLFFFVLFYNYDTYLVWSGMNREFLVISASTVVIFAGATALGWRRGYFVGWSWMLPFAFTAFLLFANTCYFPAGNYYNFLCVGLTLPRYFMGELLVASLCFGLAWIYRKWRPKGSLLWLDIVILSMIALGLLDFRLTQIMDVRLDWQVLSLAFGETPKMMWRMSRPYLVPLVVALVLMAGIYAWLLAAMRRAGTAGNILAESESGNPAPRDLPRFRLVDARWPMLGFILLGLAGIYLMQDDKARGEPVTLLVTTSPFWQNVSSPVMSEEEFSKTARQLGIWQSPQDALKRTPQRPADDSKPAAAGSALNMNVVVIFQESTYNSYLSLFSGTNDTEPLLSAYKDRMELFPNFYSSFQGSINARFATFTGLYPVGDFNVFTSHHVPVRSLFEILHDNGYSSSMFYSSYFDYTGFRDFLRGRNIDEMYDADTMPGDRTNMVSWGLREDETLNAINEQIKKYAANGQKFCLTYVPAAPHNPFDGVPPQFKKNLISAYGDFEPSYLNDLYFMDWVVTSIVDQLKDSGLLDKTLVVITGDHGEMLGQNHGPVGHGWAFAPDLGNVPLIILNPNRPGYHVNDTLGSQVDMLPTLLDLLGIPLPPGQLYQGTSLYSADADPKRTIYLSSFLQYGIFESGVLHCGERGRKNHPTGVADYYSFTNDGARTIFRPLDSAPSGVTNSSDSMSDFDRFQANFLHNYAEYCRASEQAAKAR